MKFSLHYTLQSRGGWAEEYRGFIEEVKLAESLGFSGAFVGEHHFSEDGWCPSPFLPLSAAAAETSRIRLGTDIVVLPLHNPFSVAEDTAVLDVLSSGRAILGVGLGYRKEEYAAFERDIRKRSAIYDENLKKVKDLLEGRPVRAGEFSLRIYPVPVQRPRPPIWIAAKSEEAVRRAAHRGDAWIMDPVTHINVLKERLGAYLDELGRLGKRPSDIPLRREYYVSEDREMIRRARELIAKSYEEDYYRWGHLQDEKGNEIDPAQVPYERIKDEVLDRMIIGTPSEAVEKIDMYRKALGATELMIKLSFPGIGHEERMRVIRLTAEKVMPALRD